MFAGFAEAAARRNAVMGDGGDGGPPTSALYPLAGPHPQRGLRHGHQGRPRRRATELTARPRPAVAGPPHPPHWPRR